MLGTARTDKTAAGGVALTWKECIKEALRLLRMKDDRVPLLDDGSLEAQTYHQPKKSPRSWVRKCFFFCFIFLGLLLVLIFVTEANVTEIWDDQTFLREAEKIDILSRAFFRRPKVTQDLDCQGYFEREVPKQTSRVNWTTPDNLVVNCNHILARNYFPGGALSEDERDFPLAFARIVYTDYYFLEMELATSYAPQNFYCFSIDKKATPLFHDQIHNLSKCFPNVMYTKQEYSIDSAGHYMNFAHYECLKMLIDYDWKYVALLQNHDFAIKTNAEMVQIYRWLNGANDIELRRLPDGRINRSFNWTFADLKLFRNESRNLEGYNGFPPKLNFAKGYVEGSLSRPMVDFMLKDLDLTETLVRLNNRSFGVDEVLIQTLQATDALNVPGGYMHRCVDEVNGNGHFTRKSNWYGSACGSGKQRHSMCVFGVEDLQFLTKLPHLFANKMLQAFDFGAMVCWKEHHFNRTYLALQSNATETLQADVYLNHPVVRYQTERKEPGFDPLKFKCKNRKK